MKRGFQLFDHAVGYAESLVSIASLFIICVIAFAQVVLRYVAGKSIPWSEELIGGLMVAMAMFGAARGIRLKSHTEIDSFVSILPGFIATGFRFVTTCITLIFLLLVTASSWFLFRKAGIGGLKTPYLRIPYANIYIFLVIGGALMVYEFLKIMKKRVMGTYVPRDPGEEAGLL